MPIPPPSQLLTTYSCASTTSSKTPVTTSDTTLATPHKDHKDVNAPVHLSVNRPALTRDFYLDTHFNPIWTPGPHVFSFAQDDTVVLPPTYELEPYPGYYADRTRCLGSGSVSHSQGFVRRNPKPWKNEAITEQDEVEYAARLERMRIGAVGGSTAASEEPELVYTWPPKLSGQ